MQIIKTLFAQIINIKNPKELPSDLIISPDCDILGFRFNSYYEQINVILKLIQNINNNDKPLLLIGTGEDEVDKILLPELIQNINVSDCLIANINEKTYKNIIPYVIKKGYYAILKTPIDINLAKELNILCIDIGLSPEKIIMNTDIGGLGYGYEYGYSIMEKVGLEAKNDKYLNFPLFSDASFEALKTKEAKSNDFSKSWGDLQKRSRMIELSACSGAIAAGADIITVTNPDNISILKGLV
jgi:acetyl-CoA decarbonylase/synthase complex subunit delta